MVYKGVNVHILLAVSGSSVLYSIGKGLHHIAYKILSYLDAKSLCRAEQVCGEWYQVITDGFLWKKLIERKVLTDPVWKGLSDRKGWGKYLFRHVPLSEGITLSYYRQLYPNIIKDIEVSPYTCTLGPMGWISAMQQLAKK